MLSFGSFPWFAEFMPLNSYWEVKKLLILLFVLNLVLSACQNRQTGTPIPTAEVFDLYYSPSLGYFREKMSSCISSVGTIAPYLHEQFINSIEFYSGEFFLSLGEAPWEGDNHFVTQITQENIVFVVNAKNPVDYISKHDIKEIFSGRQTNWLLQNNSDNQIGVLIYPENSDLSRWLKEALLLTETVTAPQRIAPHPKAVLEAVSKEVGAIGYVPESWLKTIDSPFSEYIKIAILEDPVEGEMTLPVLAYIINKPERGVRELLLCLQDK